MVKKIGALLIILCIGISLNGRYFTFSDLFSNEFYKDPRVAGIGTALSGHGAYGLYTRNLLHKTSTKLGLSDFIRNSVAASRINYGARMLTGAYMLSRYYTSKQEQPAYAYVPKPSSLTILTPSIR